MMNNILQNKIDGLEKWCQDKEISIFYGEINNDRLLPTVEWNFEYDKSIKDYLNSLVNSNTKILILDLQRNQIDAEDPNLLEYLEKLENESEKNKFKSILKLLKKNENCVITLRLNFIYQNINYEYIDSIDWISDYSMLLDLLSEDENTTLPSKEIITDIQIEEFANAIIKKVEFINSKNNNQRREIVYNYLADKNLTEIDAYKIKKKCDILFEVVKSNLENDIKNKIIELKNQNLKKVEIASKLGVTLGVVNKHFY